MEQTECGCEVSQELADGVGYRAWKEGEDLDVQPMRMI